MEPVITKVSDEAPALKFTLSGVNVSIANALRRIILSEIPCVVFRTTPYEKNDAKIEINTTRMNNELIKQRLSCIPIHISDVDFPIDNYILEVDKKNESDSIEYVTTEDFKIKDINSGKYLSSGEVKQIFPADPITGDYIDFVRLRPKISDEIDGEHLKLTCKFSIGMSKEDSAFNIVSKCAYANSPDRAKALEIWQKKEEELSKSGMSKDEIAYAKKDWELLDAKRYFISDSFDFVVQTVGQFSNMSIVYKAVDVMINKLKLFKNTIRNDEDVLVPSDSTMENSVDIVLVGEGYTLGKALEFGLYNKYYNVEYEQIEAEGFGGGALKGGSNPEKLLSFCGFRKSHPHIDKSIIRLGYYHKQDRSRIIDHIDGVLDDLIACYAKIGEKFNTQ